MEKGIASKPATTSLLVCGLSLIGVGAMLQALGSWRLLVMASGLALIIFVLAIQSRSKATAKDKAAQ